MRRNRGIGETIMSQRSSRTVGNDTDSNFPVNGIQGTEEMIQKGVIERLISAGLSREQAEVALLIADGVKMPEIKKTLGFRGVQQARFLKTVIGPPSQIKALVESCWQLMLLEEAEEKQKEEIENGYMGKICQEKNEKRYPGENAAEFIGETKSDPAKSGF